MPIEKSAGAIIFYQERGTIKYLLLHYGAGHWDFPKGHIEKGESEEETLRREVFEETGIKQLEIIPQFRHTIQYFFKRENRTVKKFVTFYLAKVKNKKIKLSFEHTGYKWLSYRQAKRQLTFQNAKEILQKANRFLRSVTKRKYSSTSLA
jgi:8-oxo-dGTP pyrophosphatase MutT (NUDIX family)